MLQLTAEEIRKILKYKVQEGDFAEKDGSKFMGYAAKVHSIQEVVDIYMQMRYRFADASHIMCAYRILDPDAAHMQDGVDNGEWGASRRMLKMMADENFNNVAAFVV